MARDRAAILSMAGEYDVRFTFEETEALAAGYQPKKPYRTGASELVLVIEQHDRRVILQHVLTVKTDEGKAVAIKHWRQDWTFEDPTLLEYRGGQEWSKRTLPAADLWCTWTQAVFEINDSPRYEGWGRFVHGPASSTWTSNQTWRPLPRRERERTDYDVLVGVNRHVMTPTGWVHDQDNSKVALRGAPHALVREHGLNLYSRTTKADLGTAHQFWREHEAFWRDVRAAWNQIIESRAALTFRKDSGAASLYDDLMAVEQSPSSGDRVARAQAILSSHLLSPMAGR